MSKMRRAKALIGKKIAGAGSFDDTPLLVLDVQWCIPHVSSASQGLCWIGSPGLGLKVKFLLPRFGRAVGEEEWIKVNSRVRYQEIK